MDVDEEQRLDSEEEELALEEEAPQPQPLAPVSNAPKPLTATKRAKILIAKLHKLPTTLAGVQEAAELLQASTELFPLLPWPALVSISSSVEKLAAPAVTSAALHHFMRVLQTLEASSPQLVLPVSLFQTVLALPEPKLPKLHAHRIAASQHQQQPSHDSGDDDGDGSRSKHFTAASARAAAAAAARPVTTPLQRLCSYLCLVVSDGDGGGSGGGSGVHCSRRTAAAAMTYSLLGLWDGGVQLGRQLFRDHVLLHEPRAEAIELSVETLFQGDCLHTRDACFGWWTLGKHAERA
jgi:hypothetical protein